MLDPAEHPHRRRNLLTGQWVLVSPHRARRPWLGQQEPVPQLRPPRYDPGCYLCAGNLRVTGERNPNYEGCFVFANDFSALLPDGPPAASAGDPLFELQAARGETRVLCFSPDHSRGLAELELPGVRAVIEAWCTQSEELGRRWRWVQVFENKGAAMGCSNPHPHGQIWCCDHVPNEPATEDLAQRAWLHSQGRPLLLQLAEREAELGERVVVRTEHWLAVVPYWASWPFETLLLPRFAVARLPELDAARRDDLTLALRELLVRYDNLFECDFPYSMGWHGAPFGLQDISHWQLHAHVYPPLLRSATVRKFMVGFEMLAEAQRDLTPEQAARRLRDLPARHYRERHAA